MKWTKKLSCGPFSCRNHCGGESANFKYGLYLTPTPISSPSPLQVKRKTKSTKGIWEKTQKNFRLSFHNGPLSTLVNSDRRNPCMAEVGQGTLEYPVYQPYRCSPSQGALLWWDSAAGHSPFVLAARQPLTVCPRNDRGHCSKRRSSQRGTGSGSSHRDQAPRWHISAAAGIHHVFGNRYLIPTGPLLLLPSCLVIQWQASSFPESCKWNTIKY